MNTAKERNSNCEPVQTSIRSAGDILAFSLHNLGYWPSKSLMIVTASEKGMGPQLRINLEGPPDDLLEARATLKRFLQLIPKTMRDGQERISRFFLIIADELASQGKGRLKSLSEQQPPLGEIEAEGQRANRYMPWVEAALAEAPEQGLALVDAFYLGQYSYWELDPDAPVFKISGFIDGIERSPFFLEMVTRGSVVAADENEAKELQRFHAEASCDIPKAEEWRQESSFWYKQYSQALADKNSGYCRDFISQRYAEAAIWDLAIESVVQILAQECPVRANQEGYYADRMRQSLPPEIAGFLAASLTSESSYEFPIFTAATSLQGLENLLAVLKDDNPSLLDQNQQDGIVPLDLPLTVQGGGPFAELASALIENPKQFEQVDSSKAEQTFGQIMMGQWEGQIRWGRIKALDYLLSLLLTLAEGQEKGRALYAKAWIAWFKGISSFANDYYAEAKEHLALQEPPLGLLLEASFLPHWANDPARCWLQTRE